jgi:hypothetical protein
MLKGRDDHAHYSGCDRPRSGQAEWVEDTGCSAPSGSSYAAQITSPMDCLGFRERRSSEETDWQS